MAKDSIGEWYEENLQPIFANVVDTLETSDADGGQQFSHRAMISYNSVNIPMDFTSPGLIVI